MTTSSSTSTNVPKLTMLKAKTGFIIPKNKISGSLVPVYKGVKKADGSDAAHEENTKPLQRKTKWGPDLTQDSTVRKGRALAYQTRVDQITQLLESGSLASREEKSSKSGGNAPEHEKQLELEKQEAIGEILKINPTYKVPSDYKPLTREATVPLPLREDVGYNFVRLVFGPSDTQKRVEKETGAVIRVYGTKLVDKKKIKVEVSAPDGSEKLASYHDLHVLVSADSYEKVDAAVSLIELILSSVSGKPAAHGPCVQGDDVSKSQDATSDPINSALQGSEQSGVPTPHGNIQPNPIVWPQNGGPLTGSGLVHSPPISVSPLPLYPSNMMPPPRPQQPAFPNNFTSMPRHHHPSGQSNIPLLPPRPLHQSSASMLVKHFGQVPTSPNNTSQPTLPAFRPAPSFTPVRSMGPPTPVGDFTFQPHRPDMFPRPRPHPPAPPSFRPAIAMQAHPPPPLRPPMGNQMSHLMNPNQIPPPNMGGARNHNPFPPSGGPPFINQQASFQQGPPFPRPGNPFSPNQGFRHLAPGRPNFGPGGGYQVYDPFSPTSVPAAPPPQQQGGNVRRQENDPEYEDLMASVGVK